jgi:RimJ/RimL family protein N-acetyltransferase
VTEIAPSTRPPPGGSAPGVTVRDVRWEDFEPLVRTYYEAYDERDRGEPIGITLFAERPSRADEVTWFAEIYKKVLSGDEIHLVGEVDGIPVGTCNVRAVSPVRDGEQGHLADLGILVNRRYRGRGVGTALLLGALTRARGRFEVVRLAVFVSNEAAHRLYERIGFRDHGRLAKAIRRGGRYEGEVLMSVDLASWVAPTDPANR